MNVTSTLGQLRLLAIMEGISYLLLGLTVPLKYAFEMGMPNKIVGMAHGILFIAYIIWVYIVGESRKWSWKKMGICWLASLLPFATFWVDAKYLKPLTASE